MSKQKSGFEIGVDMALKLISAIFSKDDKRNSVEKLNDSMKEVKSECEKTKNV